MSATDMAASVSYLHEMLGKFDSKGESECFERNLAKIWHVILICREAQEAPGWTR